MQRPGFNQGYPGMPNNGMPMQPGGPGMGQQPYYSQSGPQYAPGYGMPNQGAPGMPPQNFQPNAGCFMPAATIRKISNTMPPRFDPPFK